MEFPSVEDILAIHEELIAPGGPGNDAGVHSVGTLETAVDRARNGPFWKPRPEIADRAAFYLRHIAQEHPFVEGNKRTAFETVDTFLRANGWRIRVSREEAIPFLLDVAGRRLIGASDEPPEPMPIEEMAEWIRKHMEKA